jgi:hypothetical protein
MLTIGVPAIGVAILALVSVFRNRRDEAGAAELPVASAVEANR